MKLTISYQLQDFLKSLGADISILLQKAKIPNKLRQEEVNLTSLEFYRLLTSFSSWIRSIRKIFTVQENYWANRS